VLGDEGREGDNVAYSVAKLRKDTSNPVDSTFPLPPESDA